MVIALLRDRCLVFMILSSKFNANYSTKLESSVNTILLALKILVATSIYFVWVVRYDNIIKEFKEYGLPEWLRDLTGILKMTFAAMLLFGTQDNGLDVIGSLGIAGLMLCAQITHLRTGTAAFRRLPSLVLLTISLVIFYFSFFATA
jgi:hypothetical protein